MTDEGCDHVEKMMADIDAMTQEQMARLWRFASAGSPYFQGVVGKYFVKVFKEKGGFTPEISKRLGW